MNIAFLTSEYPHPKVSNSAGIGTSIYNLAQELVKNSIEVAIFVYGQNNDEVFKDGLVTIYKIAHKKYKFLGWYLYRKHLQNSINKIVVKEKINLLEAPDWTGITAFMNIKCPIVIRVHGSDTYFCHLEKRKQKWKNYWFEKLGLKKANNIISVSQFTAIKTKELFNLKREIQTIHNSIDIDKFYSLKNDGEGTLLYFGTFIRKKGVLELANIFNKIVEKRPKTRLQLIGKDVVDIIEKVSTRELFLGKLSKHAKTKVQIIDEVPYEQIREYIAKATVIVLPSFAEAFPMTWLEAMAMEKALVTSNIGWAPEMMIDGETGYTVHPKKHKIYSDKIIQLLDNDHLRTTFGKNARQRITENFSKEIIYKKNIKYYKSIIGSK